jgi:transposase
MSQERLSMKKLKEVLRLHYECKLSNRQIARALNLSATTVGHYVKAALAAGMIWQDIVTFNDNALIKLLEPYCPQLQAQYKQTLIDLPYIHHELKKKGVTRELLHEEYLRNCTQNQGVSYSEFCRQYREFKKQLKPSMRQTHLAGHKTFVDYAGPKIPIYDRDSGEIRPAVIFVGVLGASNYTYAEATMTRSLPDWIGSHVRMFEYFGGVTAMVIPDNEKSAVNHACYYDPDINPNYTALAAHYNTVIMPARPYHPKDKSKAEVGVQVVERWILARLRHQQFFSLAELNAAIAKWLCILNDKPFQKLPGTRHSVFETLEKQALQPLPKQPYEFTIIKKAQVNLDYHVEVERHYYSVPHQYIHKTIEYHLGERSVSIFYQGERVALHARSHLVGKATTIDAHMPKAHQAHQSWTPQEFVLFSQSIGDSMATLTEKLIEKNINPECCYRIHLGFKNLAKRFGDDRLNEACQYALQQGLLSFKQVKSILNTQCDQLVNASANDPEIERKPCQHNNLRGAKYYSTITTGDN